MPDKSTIQDNIGGAVPVTCQQCGKTTWRKTDNWPPPVLCPMCEAEAEGVTFAQAMEELFDA